MTDVNIDALIGKRVEVVKHHRISGHGEPLEFETEKLGIGTIVGSHVKYWGNDGRTRFICQMEDGTLKDCPIFGTKVLPDEPGPFDPIVRPKAEKPEVEICFAYELETSDEACMQHSDNFRVISHVRFDAKENAVYIAWADGCNDKVGDRMKFKRFRRG